MPKKYDEKVSKNQMLESILAPFGRRQEVHSAETARPKPDYFSVVLYDQGEGKLRVWTPVGLLLRSEGRAD